MCSLVTMALLEHACLFTLQLESVLEGMKWLHGTKANEAPHR